LATTPKAQSPGPPPPVKGSLRRYAPLTGSASPCARACGVGARGPARLRVMLLLQVKGVRLRRTPDPSAIGTSARAMTLRSLASRGCTAMRWGRSLRPRWFPQPERTQSRSPGSRRPYPTLFTRRPGRHLLLPAPRPGSPRGWRSVRPRLLTGPAVHQQPADRSLRLAPSLVGTRLRARENHRPRSRTRRA